MATKLITTNVWQTITAAAKKSKTKSYVAVAYFGKDGAKMLPLTKGSMLLVDASDNAIKSLQTCPAALIELYDKGVHIYSLANLHAKVFVIGKSLYIGSANVSSNSSGPLKEAIYVTSETKSVAEAKAYVESHCKVDMGLDQLNRLKIIYDEYYANADRKGRGKSTASPEVKMDFFNLHYSPGDDKDDVANQNEIGTKEAAQHRIKKSRHVVQGLHNDGKATINKHDIIQQVYHEGKSINVYPPGIVIHIRTWTIENEFHTIYFVERPNTPKRSIKWFKNKLDAKDYKLLEKDDNGKRSKAFAEKMYSLWKLKN